MNNQDYLAQVEKFKSEKKPIEIEMPSGSVWLCLPISIAQFAATDQLPSGLFSKPDGKKSRQATEEELADLGYKGALLTRDVMLNNLVYPKVSLEPSPDTILPEQIDPEDFDHFMKFVIRGGQAQYSFRGAHSSK